MPHRRTLQSEKIRLQRKLIRQARNNILNDMKNYDEEIRETCYKADHEIYLTSFIKFRLEHLKDTIQMNNDMLIEPGEVLTNIMGEGTLQL